MKLRDIGKKYGSLEVIEVVRDYEKKRTYYICRCECGREVKVLKDNVVSGRSKSCGCRK